MHRTIALLFHSGSFFSSRLLLCVPLNFRSFNDFEKKTGKLRPLTEIIFAKINFAQLKTLLLINRAYVVLLWSLQHIASTSGVEKAAEIQPTQCAERNYVVRADLCAKGCALWKTNRHEKQWFLFDYGSVFKVPSKLQQPFWICTWGNLVQGNYVRIVMS